MGGAGVPGSQEAGRASHSLQMQVVGVQVAGCKVQVVSVGVYLRCRIQSEFAIIRYAALFVPIAIGICFLVLVF
jgi:hypothetical protein